GSFVIYSGSGCTEEFERHQLGTKTTAHQDKIIGFFAGQIWKTSKAANKHVWVTYNPFSAHVPNSTAIFLLTFLLHLHHCVLQYIEKRHRFWLNLLFLNVFRLILRAVHIVYWYIPIDNWDTFAYLSFTYYSLFGLESLWTIYVSSFQIFQLEVLRLKPSFRVLLLAFITILHLVLYGGHYLRICRVHTMNCKSVLPFYSVELLDKWYKFTSWW
ncbi:hypothetical protein BC833DRAFT_605540, partial [Globomyces pollinis-pini]